MQPCNFYWSTSYLRNKGFTDKEQPVFNNEAKSSLRMTEDEVSAPPFVNCMAAHAPYLRSYVRAECGRSKPHVISRLVALLSLLGQPIHHKFPDMNFTMLSTMIFLRVPAESWSPPVLKDRCHSLGMVSAQVTLDADVGCNVHINMDLREAFRRLK